MGTSRKDDEHRLLSSPAGRRVAATALVPALSLMLLVGIGAAATAAWVGPRGEAVARAFLAIGLGYGLATVWPWWTLGWGARDLARLGALAGALRLAVIPWMSATRPPYSSEALWTGIAMLVLGFVIALQNRRAGRRTSAITLQSPLTDGTFAVVQGGSAWVNHHARHRSQQFALDLVKVTAWRGRSRRWLPQAFDDYRAFGDPVVAPIAGTVVAATDGIDDGGSTIPATGNSVTIEPAEHPGHRVVLAHLRKGTVAVQPGQRLSPGNRLGEIGSSGNSTEPHLHLHVEDDGGAGVPMRIGTRRPLQRNDLIRSRRA
jgi:murein DD-endopeptidase MepM/ murein hydrolase activator NlpD